ncbi:RNA polymerase sigma factor [Bacteroidota bacterium]
MSKYENLSDLELFEKIATYDTRALEELYERYSPILYSLIKKIVTNKETAEQILIEVFVIVWRKIHLFNFKTGNVYTWLITLTRNRAADSLQRNRASAEDIKNYNDAYEDYFILPMLPKYMDPLDLETALNLKTKVEEALDKLTDAQKYVIHLSFYECHTLDEISEKLNLNADTVRQKLMAAVTNLRDKLLEG